MQHLQLAKRIAHAGLLDYNQSQKQKLLYTHMLKIGLDTWRIYSIEHIEAVNNEAFKISANARELFWIKYFNTRNPSGLNMILPVAIEDSSKKATKIHDNINAVQDIVGEAKILVPYKRRCFGSRIYNRRIQYLSKLVEEDKFNYKTLDSYSVKNLQALLNRLENVSDKILKIPLHTAQILRSWTKNKLLKSQLPVKVIKTYRFMLKFTHKQVHNLRIKEYSIITVGIIYYQVY